MASGLSGRSRLQSHLLKIWNFKEPFRKYLAIDSQIHRYKRLLRRLDLASRHRKEAFPSLSTLSCCRCMCTSSQGPRTLEIADPYKLVEEELASLNGEIKREIQTNNESLGKIAQYYFDGKGKSFRPMLVMLVAQAFNSHVTAQEQLLESQRKIAMISEMIHTASLMHDDVIDAANTRRGKDSINQMWGQRKAILAGDYVMSMASIALAKIRNEQVVSIVSQITMDLVRGEFMQLGSKENEDERFNHYLEKTYKKTASLLANSCRAVAVLGNCDQKLSDLAFEYGRNVGITFQLIDDLLDFTSCDQVMGKPTAADLKLGLATAPVLFAAHTHPQLNEMIMRRFSHEGDVEKARELVAKSNGVKDTQILAEEHSLQALRLIQKLNHSPSSQALQYLSKLILNRSK